jgi:hypothetical protein
MLVEDLRPDDTVRLDADTLLEGNLQSLEPDEWAMYKPRWGAFSGTKLKEILQSRNVNHPRRVWLQLYELSEGDRL